MQAAQPEETGRKTGEPERAFWTIADFCSAHGRSKTFVYDALASGELDGVKCGRSTLLTDASVKRWRASLPKYQPGSPLNCGAAQAAA